MNFVHLVNVVIQVYSFLILIYCLFTWFPIKENSLIDDVFGFLRKVCDPYLNLFRRIIPPIGGSIDISPIVALLVLQLAGSLIIRLLTVL